MVDALQRAHRLVRPGGVVVDLHPTMALASVEVGPHMTGRVEVDDGPLRHAAAGAALIRVIDAGLFVVDGAVEFTFHTYGDSIEELRAYVEENWVNARIDESVVDRTRAALRAAPGARLRIREDVRLTRLHPIAPVE
jgi:hypothetical protein